MNSEHIKDKSAEDRYFVLSHGKTVHTLRQLSEEIDSVPDAIFKEHQQRKDFSTWISAVFGESELAHSLSSCKTKKAFRKKLDRWLMKTGNAKPGFSEWLRRKENDFLMDILCFVLGGIVGALITLLAVGFV